MKILNLDRKKLDFKEFIKRGAQKSDCSAFLSGDHLITENDVPKILYKHLDIDTSELLWAVKRIKFFSDTRTTGLVTTSRIFGYSPRNAIRRDYCSATGLAKDNPTEHAVICGFGEKIAKLYEVYFPAVYAAHTSVVTEKVKPEWHIRNTPFTSGIVNKNNPLKYHFDAGNVKNVLSNMVVFKKNTDGGFLNCPEFDIQFETAHNTVILFDGQSILHGVTPIKSLSDASYRYSVVYYTLQQMWNCLPLTEEIIRARKSHLNKERKRAEGNVTGLQYDKKS